MVYTPDQVESFAAAEGITSKEYLDKYRVSGSAYSVSTNTVTQERVNEAKSQVSDALGFYRVTCYRRNWTSRNRRTYG